MSTAAIVLAGGMGSRFGGPVPKQLSPLAGETVIYHTLRVVDGSADIDELVVVANPDWEREIANEAARAVRRLPLSVVPGGASRNESLRNALSALTSSIRHVLIHDSVRPLIDHEIIRRVVEALGHARCVLPVVSSSDLLVKKNPDGTVDFPSRQQVLLGQAPQGFHLEDLFVAFARERDHVTLGLPTVYQAVLSALPDAMPMLVEGLPENIKITLPVDHMVAQRLLEGRFGLIEDLDASRHED